MFLKNGRLKLVFVLIKKNIILLYLFETCQKNAWYFITSEWELEKEFLCLIHLPLLVCFVHLSYEVDLQLIPLFVYVVKIMMQCCCCLFSSESKWTWNSCSLWSTGDPQSYNWKYHSFVCIRHNYEKPHLCRRFLLEGANVLIYLKCILSLFLYNSLLLCEW